MERERALAAVWLLGLAAIGAANAAPAGEPVAFVRFDPAHTVVAFRLEGGLHDTHGAFLLKEGSLRVDRSNGAADGLVVVDAASGDSGNSSRDARMRDGILEATKYPEIRFRPAKVDGSLAPDGSFHAEMHGTLTLHGADHAVTLPVEGRLGSDGWTATCRFAVPYVAWGLSDPSVLFLTVAKEVEIEVKATGDVRWTPTTVGGCGRSGFASDGTEPSCEQPVVGMQ
jgi:polyisoprenoid-binding protein YceI